MRLWGKRGSDRAKPEPKNWREAAAAEAFHMATPSIPAQMPLCTHLGVDEPTRQELQRVLVEGWAQRPNSLVMSFLAVADAGPIRPVFPPEIAEIVWKRHPRLAQNEHRLREEIATIYIRHEQARWHQRAELERMIALRAQRQPLMFVKILTCEDQRVCPTCQGYHGVRYRLGATPTIPAHWDCRCFYTGVID